ncbi:DUF3016 domain-containing protein [Luteimonas sp. MC1782]|nr:DUF3016 domain-containing protein [Luteimonas sp. MC1895]MBJ6983291.1 DUF3016 domain-containing protein [Luteimonas sp. MC1750]QQO07165.1 DUF3016 domain-containing protein [Luteimonas sp. MC1750]
MIPALAIALAVVTGPALADRVTDPDVGLSLEDGGPVAVSWTAPADFTEIRHSRNRFEAVRGDWVRDLARHVADRAARALHPGERLEVRITDIDRAGDYEPGRGASDHVRVVRDIYPPRIDLAYTLRDASGQVVASGERSLRDLGFLQRQPGTVGSSDPLRHEKQLVDRWVRTDLARADPVRGDR